MFLLPLGYFFGDFINHSDFLTSLYSLGGQYAKIARKQYIFHDEIDMNEKLSAGTYGVYAKQLSDGHLYDCEQAKGFASSYRMMKNYVLKCYVGYAFQKDSPYTRLFNHYIFRYLLILFLSQLKIKMLFYNCRLLESGIIKHWCSDVMLRYGQNFDKFFHHPSKLEDVRHSLSLDKLSGAFYVLIIGLLISFCVFFIELCVKYANTN